MKSLFLNWWGWWAFAIVTRILASKTHTHWFHPDEWCQTLEPASLIANGFGIHSQEIGLHLRNLSWASLLASILSLTKWIDPRSIELRVFSVNLLCGILDLFILWGWIQLFNKTKLLNSTSHRVKHLGLAILLLPWFTVYESVSPRAEHLSEIATWAGLGFLALESWFAAGVASAAIVAVRYPSGLISAGICISVVIQSVKSGRVKETLGRYSAGLISGGLLFGIADFLIYGRPWESLWMYLQYNVFTGSSSLIFGEQGIAAYAETFIWNWTTYPFLIPIGILLALFSCVGIFQGLKKTEPWAICLFLYLAGHLWVPHKEGRFIIPIETLLRWSAFVGICVLWPYARKWGIALTQEHPRLIRPIQSLCVAFIGIQGLIFLHHLKADYFKERGLYRELGSLFSSSGEEPRVCGVITPIFVTSILIPNQGKPSKPDPAIGTLLFDQNAGPAPFSETQWKAHIRWIQHPPTCTEKDTVLLEVRQATRPLESAGCKILAAGIFKFLPERAKEWVLDSKISVPAWYRCPSEVLARFTDQYADEIFSSSFGKISSLPPLGITALDLQNLGLQTSPPPRNAFTLPSVPTLKSGPGIAASPSMAK